MKKSLILIVVALCFISSTSFATEMPQRYVPSPHSVGTNRPFQIITPRYEVTSDISASLSFSGSKANCSGKITPSGNYSVSLTVTLYKQNGSSWTKVTSWTGSSTSGKTASASGSVSVSKGTYKVVASGNVGGKEYPSKSVSRTY